MLTEREIKVVELVCVGYSDKEAADVLSVSPRTIVNHKQNIFQKLQINKSTELAAWYWCKKFNVNFDLTQLKKQAVALILMLVLLPSSLEFDHTLFRRSRCRAKTEIRTRKGV